MALAAAIVLVGIAPLIESIRRFVFVGRGTLMPTVPTEHLVVSGFYRHVRNPMYVGVLLALVGEAVLFEKQAMIVYLAIVALLIHLFVSLYEEPTLARRYAEEYRRYKRNVPRWLPRLSPWNGKLE
jgi:protein-S-isoprenylcysteine O-methyltransferase Ste14